MKRRIYLISVAFLIVVTSTCYFYLNDRILSAKQIAADFCSSNHLNRPQRISVYTTTSDSNGKKMYVITLYGAFEYKGFASDKISFSALANGLYTWNVSAYDKKSSKWVS